MMKLWQRRTLGILAVGGGAVGIAAALPILPTRTNPLEWLFCLAFVALYAWGVWCGVRLLEEQPGAERSNLKYWLIQVPAFGSPFIGYFLSSGFHTTFWVQLSPFKFNVNFLLGSTFQYSLLESGKPLFVGINVFAALIAWWLARTLRDTASNNSFKPTPQSGAA